MSVAEAFRQEAVVLEVGGGAHQGHRGLSLGVGHDGLVDLNLIAGVDDLVVRLCEAARVLCWEDLAVWSKDAPALIVVT